jgi:hypothetical protein
MLAANLMATDTWCWALLGATLFPWFTAMIYENSIHQGAQKQSALWMTKAIIQLQVLPFFYSIFVVDIQNFLVICFVKHGQYDQLAFWNKALSKAIMSCAWGNKHF